VPSRHLQRKAVLPLRSRSKPVAEYVHEVRNLIRASVLGARRGADHFLATKTLNIPTVLS